MAAPNIDFQVATIADVPGMSKGAKRRRQSKKTPKGGKRGNPGHFHGSRAVMLDSFQPEFKLLKGKPLAAQTAFWERVYGSYWAVYLWYVPLDVEPEDFVGFEPPLDTPEALEEKKKVIEQTQQVRGRSYNSHFIC